VRDVHLDVAGENVEFDAANARPRPDGSDIQKLREEHVPQVLDAVARAFYDDPLMSWVVPRDSRRKKRLLAGFGLFLRRIWLPQGECYTTDRLAGGSFWLPPGTWHIPVREQLRLLPATIRAFGRDFSRLARILAAVDAKHPRAPHYYLPVVGVAPEWQGRGFGAALLRPVLERCDREHMPAYLEASTPRNRALYERCGFGVKEELSVGGSPPFWLMWREPG
jgi:ribosomal protein S18 acetylase RimI-like enzyme